MAAKKKKLEQLSQTNGKVETFRPTTLAQIFGEQGSRKYGTDNISEYRQKLKTMNKTDLHAHARTIGIMPDDNYSLLIGKLEQEFLSHVNAYKIPTATANKPIKMTPELAKILAEGR